MEATPSASITELNRAFSEPSPAFQPTQAALIKDVGLEQLEAYQQRKYTHKRVFHHSTSDDDLIIIESQRKDLGHMAYYVHWQNSRANTWLLFKGTHQQVPSQQLVGLLQQRGRTHRTPREERRRGLEEQPTNAPRTWLHLPIETTDLDIYNTGVRGASQQCGSQTIDESGSLIGRKTVTPLDAWVPELILLALLRARWHGDRDVKTCEIDMFLLLAPALVCFLHSKFKNLPFRTHVI